MSSKIDRAFESKIESRSRAKFVLFRAEKLRVSKNKCLQRLIHKKKKCLMTIMND